MEEKRQCQHKDLVPPAAGARNRTWSPRQCQGVAMDGSDYCKRHADEAFDRWAESQDAQERAELEDD